MSDSAFPLQERAAFWGLVLGGVVGAVCLSPLAGFAVAVLVWTVGSLWRRGEPPVLSFCLGMQWISVVTGYAHLALTGTYPGQAVIGEIDLAVVLSLLGLLCLALGMRLALSSFWVRRSHAVGGDPAPTRYDVRRLFWCVVCLYTINWFIVLNPRVLGGAAEIASNLLLARVVLLCFLIVTALRQRDGYGLAIAAFVYALVPAFASAMSNFKEFFFLMLLMLLTQWQPWARDDASQARNRRVVALAAGLCLGLVAMGLVWEGAVKPLWRPAAMSGAIGGSPAERLGNFGVVLGKASGAWQLGESVEALAARLSSGAAYFSLVLARVPDVLPHEEGGLSRRALLHILQPRILFPDKPILESDSWLVRTYAGLAAAGGEFGTSIGLGYMAQLYIDFGATGLLLALTVYGAYLGVLYRTLRAWSPSGDLFGCAAAVLFVQHFITYDGEIAKQVGGLTQTFLIFTALLHLLGPGLLRWLTPAAGGRALGGGVGAARLTTAPRR